MGMSASQARLLLLTSRKSDLELRAQFITQTKMLLAMQTEEAANDYTRAISNRTMMFTWGVNQNKGTENSEILTYDSLISSGITGGTSFRVVMSDGAIVARNEHDPVIQSSCSKTKLIDKQAETGKETDAGQEQSRVEEIVGTFEKYSDGSGGRILYKDGSSREVVFCSLLDNRELFQNALQQGSLFLEAMALDPDGSESNWKSFSWSSSEKFSEEYNTEDDARAEAKYQKKMAELQTREKKLDTELKQIETQQSACQTEMESVKGYLKKNVQDGFKVFG